MRISYGASDSSILLKSQTAKVPTLWWLAQLKDGLSSREHVDADDRAYVTRGPPH